MGRAWGVVVAAGRGRRFGGHKQVAELEGRPLWQWARQALLEGGVEEVVMVGPVPGGVPGGRRRRDSVAAGLERVPEGAAWVLVHDAVRPLASPDLVRRVLERLEVGDVQGVVPGIPVRDALKRVEGEWVVATADRAGLVAVQTPQGFPPEVLRDAHRRSDEDAPDDAALVERAGGKVAVIEGEIANVKITYPDDLRLAEAFLAPRREVSPP